MLSMPCERYSRHNRPSGLPLVGATDGDHRYTPAVAFSVPCGVLRPSITTSTVGFVNVPVRTATVGASSPDWRYASESIVHVP